MTTLFQQHIQRWQSGCGNDICQRARNKCFARGTIPCDILFCGEAPGSVENVLAQPFTGPAGQLLDVIVKRSVPAKFTTCFGNMVLCLPTGEEGGKSGEPLPEEVRNCAPRLLEFISICKPRLVVFVGNLARDSFDPKTRHHLKLPEGVPSVAITHPAYMLARCNQVQRGLQVQRAALTIASAIEEHLGG